MVIKDIGYKDYHRTYHPIGSTGIIDYIYASTWMFKPDDTTKVITSLSNWDKLFLTSSVKAF